MKYQDSIKQADVILAQAIKQLQLWHLAATPINYAISYEFVAQTNKALTAAIKYQLSTGKKLDNFYMEAVYQQFILGQSKFRDEMLSEFDGLINSVQTNVNDSTISVDSFISKLDSNLNDLKSGDKEKVNHACNNLAKATIVFKTEQQRLTERLQKVQKNSQELQLELEDIRKEIYLDPLTGLYNRKAMSKNIEAWYKENPDKSVAAIVINVDQYSQITQRFGTLIGDVLLSKIAHKIESYVDDSGLPIRTGGDEFLILLPEVDSQIAYEIGEKIREGVSKLRFISSKSGVRLPQMTISVGVNKFNVSQNVNAVIDKTRNSIST
ncbi:GGDEF domain-containing protein [Pseudocolwellia agarivorans]|uniref:GGDEF domain-containing protein n=1 Tax=Pseudocolwellia agarivorans TaxID=1911682 RepID=UPI0009844AE2|nr:GGDEF domain-containing protein [Pseudocolwellia agarivorans]